jgi:chromosome segregation protein
MYLKSIEVHGFKSFANKIIFEFHNGITGIVGPNGSGKSNVADAVRWVLGEQRVKQLRGGTMQDVIFSGTELRKPQGFAYVAITLDNSDHQLAIEFDEVTVSRRLYRSGESEYMINGSACRLKDINELFYDTGIGKEGYSIIGQGQIDRILSGKPEERRELFDEAAGIVKFKRRKAIAQKKLEDEQQNLVRVSDILSELEKQVGPLARQSETARKYLALREELKTFDVNLFLMESEQIRAQLKDVESRTEIVNGDLGQANAQSEEQKTEYDRLDGVLSELDQTINEKRTLFNQAEMLGTNLEGQINVLNEQINTEQLRAEHIQERSAALEQEIVEKKNQITAYQTDNRDINDAVDASRRNKIAAEYALAQDEANIEALEQQLETAQNDMIVRLNEKADLTARGQRFEAMLEQVQVRRAELLQKLLKYKSDESAQDEDLQAEQQKLADAENRLNELQTAQTECESETDRLEMEVHRLTRSLNARQQDYHTANTKLDSLRNLAERYEGYGNSTRRVMEVKDRVRGIRGVVADLITTEKRYETAIETALGGSIQNVVTDTEQTAKQLIEYLKKNRFGRVTFLPLNSIGQSGGFTKPEVLREPGVIGLGSDLVHVAPEYEVLARYLLGRVVVAETIDHALALARKYKYSLRIVTLEGELLNAGGSLTGGAFKNNSNLLGRRRELEELEKVCKKAQQDVDQLDKELKLQEGILSEKKEELEQLRKAIHEASLRQNTLSLGVSQIEERRDNIRESSRDLVTENSQLEQQIHEIEENRRTIRSDTTVLEEQHEQVNASIAALTQQLDEAKAVREQSLRKLEEINLEAAALKQKVDFAMENIRRVEEEISRLTAELEGLRSGAGNSEEIISGKQAEIENLKSLIIHASEEKTALSGELQVLAAQKEETAARQKTFFAKREELSDRINRLDKDLFRLQSQKEKLDEKLESQINYMWSEYELTLTTAAPLRNPELAAIGEIRRKIEELKTSIRGLGNVNVNAIEDYKEISERYEFMKTQHDDLVEAEATLLKIIDELDEGMRRQFEEKFREIREEFNRVFKELFGGGHGTLELMEDMDILEAGIQIIAQPPGKKLQNMMQLSGGEKALTAIALLFAIQNLKPSPFCLLDEIEAALDDSNVDRFAGYLHKLTKNTQFIVITHRRGTMVSADRLYGITMQEKGVSTLVSVNLIEDQLEK